MYTLRNTYTTLSEAPIGVSQAANARNFDAWPSGCAKFNNDVHQHILRDPLVPKKPLYQGKRHGGAYTPSNVVPTVFGGADAPPPISREQQKILTKGLLQPVFGMTRNVPQPTILL